ncbi:MULTISPECIES: tail protein X [Lysobacter]
MIANPGLADLGPVLPHGTAVDLPDPVTRAPDARPLIQLWD